MFSLSTGGSTKRTEDFLRKLSRGDMFASLDSIAREGVTALAAASPVDSGLAANSWGYKIEKTRSSCTITWFNTDVENGFPVAIMLQYGYSTGTGGYVRGRDYINPAMKPIFDRLEARVRKAVTSA